MLTLLLVATLENSGRRAEHELDAVAVALLEQRDGEAYEDLERAIGMHDEV